MEQLRAENAALKDELKLWKGDTELPKIGSYYFADELLIEIHGCSFGDNSDCTPLRYEGTRWRSITRVDGSEAAFFEHVFTAPYTYDDDDAFDRSGWIKLGFETFNLHRISPVEWDADWNIPLRYLSSDDTIEIWDYAEEE